MACTVTHTRAFSGSNITVAVKAEEKESLRSVEIELDGDSLEFADLEPGTETFQREFSGVGDAGPGTNHDLTVTVVNWEEQSRAFITRWTDTM